MTADRRRGAAARGGMTLLEVLVAFIIFLFMVMALVSLATAGLDTWTAGEERKDQFDRAQRLLDQIGEDLRSAWADDQWHIDAGSRELQHAHFTCDADANKTPRLRFVRGGSLHRMNVDPAIRIRRPQRDLNYTDLWEVVYVMDGDPEKPKLWRGVRFFDRRTTESLLNADDIKSTTASFFRQNATVVDTGVLWIGFRFWTSSSSTWALPTEDVYACANRVHPGVMTTSAPSKCPGCGRDMQKMDAQPVRRGGNPKEVIGPSLLWDSSRTLSEGELGRFVHHRSRKMRDDPDFVYPEIVQVTLVLETQASESRGTRLTETISDTESQIRLDHTRGMADGPNMIKIGAEWIEYAEKSISGVRVKRRGARGTTAAQHEGGARVRFGETFTMDVHVPAYKEASR